MNSVSASCHAGEQRSWFVSASKVLKDAEVCVGAPARRRAAELSELINTAEATLIQSCVAPL